VGELKSADFDSEGEGPLLAERNLRGRVAEDATTVTDLCVVDVRQLVVACVGVLTAGARDPQYRLWVVSWDGSVVHSVDLQGAAAIAAHHTLPLVVAGVNASGAVRGNPLVEAIESGAGETFFFAPCNTVLEAERSRRAADNVALMSPAPQQVDDTTLRTIEVVGVLSSVAGAAILMSLLWTVTALLYNAWWLRRVALPAIPPIVPL
jgi:hypothetical protein